jgi:hypothetical protein
MTSSQPKSVATSTGYSLFICQDHAVSLSHLDLDDLKPAMQKRDEKYVYKILIRKPEGKRPPNKT